jgi:RNA polymerase sigma-70 factor, ECF subfamily
LCRYTGEGYLINTTSTDIEIIQKIATFESKALEALYNRYSSILYTTIKKIVTDERLAEEILTEVFVIIWKKGKKFNHKNGSVYTWLVLLARNKAVDVVRRLKEGNELPEYTEEYEDEFIIPHLSPVLENIDLKIASGLKSNVESALSRLTDAQQYVLSLAFYEGLTENDIALKLNIPVETVRSKIRTALTNFKTNLMSKG